MDHPQNILLDRPKLLLPSRPQIGRLAYYCVVLLLGGFAPWICFLTAFQIQVHGFSLAVAGLAGCGFSIWRRADSRKRWCSATLLGWGLWLLAGLLLFDRLAHGGVRVLNIMLSAYGAKLNYQLPALALSYTAAGAHPDPAAECTALMNQILFPFFWIMGRGIYKYKSPLSAFLLSAVVLVLPMGFSILPAGWALGALLLFWCLLLLTGRVLRGRQGLFGRGRKDRCAVPGEACAGPGALLLVPILAVCMVGLYLAYPPEGYSRPALVNEMRSGIQHGFGLSAHLRGGQGNGNSQVNLNTMGGRSYTGETVLRVKFDWEAEDRVLSEGKKEVEALLDQWGLPHKEYLKSFVGSVYTGHSWERLDPEAQRELKDLGLNVQTLPAGYKRLLNLEEFGVDLPLSFQLSVENMGANPRCVYIPYTLDTPDARLGQLGIQRVDDGFAKSSSLLAGTREYQVEGFPSLGGVDYYTRVFYKVASAYQENGQSTPMTIEDRNGALVTIPTYNSELVGRLSASMIAQLDAGGPQWDGGNQWKLEEGLSGVLGDEAAALLGQVEDYTEFVYQHYAQLPEELSQYLTGYREAMGLEGVHTFDDGYTAHVPVDQFITQIQDLFSQYYTYSLNPPQPPEGEDFVRFFLEDSRQGYCVHFATAAVALLRSAGYPARYAEGYVAPSTQEGWVEVPDYNAHAWVEVYAGGRGWVPVEVTPATPDAPAVYADATVPEEDSAGALATPRPIEAVPTLPPQDFEPTRPQDWEPSFQPNTVATPRPAQNPGAASSTEGAVLIALAGILLVLLMAGALGGRVLRRRLRNRAFAQPDRDQAALRAYAWLQKLYRWEALCGQREPEPTFWKELAEKARFGRKMLGEEELAQLTEEVARLEGKLRRQLPKGQKLRCWLAGLL